MATCICKVGEYIFSATIYPWGARQGGMGVRVGGGGSVSPGSGVRVFVGSGAAVRVGVTVGSGMWGRVGAKTGVSVRRGARVGIRRVWVGLRARGSRVGRAEFTEAQAVRRKATTMNW